MKLGMTKSRLRGRGEMFESRTIKSSISVAHPSKLVALTRPTAAAAVDAAAPLQHVTFNELVIRHHPCRAFVSLSYHNMND